MKKPRLHRDLQVRSAFSLIEMVVVVAILSLLVVAGINLLNDTGPQARKTSTDRLSALIEQARTTAITSRSKVVLAIAEPRDLPTEDTRCRIGLFKIPEWQDGQTTVDGVLLRRWQPLEQGVVLLGGGVEGLRNPLDEPELTVRYTAGNRTIDAAVHAVAFTARGGLYWPTGSDPVALRIVEGGYRGPLQKATANKRHGTDVSENRLKIGRVLGRPYRYDP